VLAEQDNYAKSGFRLACRNLRYRGRAADAAVAASVVPAAKVPFEAVCDLDRQIFPERRSAFLRAWLAQPAAGAYVAQDQGRPIGYTLVRQCREGWKIGPLVADNIDAAQALYDAASAHATCGQFLDIPETNLAAQTPVAARGLIPVFETARMYTGPDPAIDVSKLFGVTTFELG
jgi:Acetyltransferase (GNAT) domain